MTELPLRAESPPPTPPAATPRGSAHVVRASALQLVGLLEEHGPSAASQLARRMDLHLTTVIYHLRRLEKRGAVVRRGRLWGVAQRPPGLKGEPRLGPAMVRLVELLRTRQELDHQTIATLLDVSRPAVTALVARLVARGWVRVQASERRKLVSLATAPPLATLLPMPPMPPSSSPPMPPPMPLEPAPTAPGDAPWGP